ncbi:hypothetical protein ACOBQX_23925 [Actinokineospora sp. G85]|uniref:hypothetical protein n=1 Tax=Actinokineospora sp. G85 TaxID=3406626 RepID=UPI003C72EFB1
MTSNRAALDLDRLPALFPHGVARSTELVGLGLSGGRIAARCGPGGPWQHLDHGVIFLGDDPPGRLQRLQAALRVAGPGAVITGREALWLHGADVPPSGAIHLVVPANSRSRADGSVLVERTSRIPEALWRKGFPTAPAARAVVDACKRTASEKEVRALALANSVALSAIRAEVAEASPRGTVVLRRVLAEVDRGVRSAGTRIVTELIRRAGLPTPKWTVRLTTSDDVHLGIVDAWWGDVGLAWDADVHRPWAPRDQASASARVARLTARGVVALHTEPARIRDDTAAVIAELRGAYRAAADRPRPKVVAHLD